jgi:predicted GTPase
VEDIPNPVATKVRAVVMGQCGCGKSSLFNKLCNRENETGFALESLTRDIDFEDVVYIENKKFRMYDTPGTDSTADALHHAMILRASLTNLPINLIMVSAKLDSRYAATLREFKTLQKIIKGYEKLVVCLISHLDKLEEKEKSKIMEDISKTVK